MAIVDDNTHTDSDSRGFAELKTIDINDSSLPEGKEVEIDPNADAWGVACPLPDGIYKLKLFEARNPYQMGKTDDGDIYYTANLECRVQSDNSDLKDRIVFGKASTYVAQGKEVSTIVGLIKKIGPTIVVPTKITPKQQLQLFRRVLAKEPTLYCEGEWAAWDMPKSEWIKRGMKNFPKHEDGKSFNHSVRDSKGNTVNAKWKVVKWYGLKEYKEMLEKEEARKRQFQGQGQGQGQGVKQTSNIANIKQDEVGDFQEIKTNALPLPIVVKDDDFVIEE